VLSDRLSADEGVMGISSLSMDFPPMGQINCPGIAHGHVFFMVKGP
jgi:hypothetical protein